MRVWKTVTAQKLPERHPAWTESDYVDVEALRFWRSIVAALFCRPDRLFESEVCICVDFSIKALTNFFVHLFGPRTFMALVLVDSSSIGPRFTTQW